MRRAIEITLITLALVTASCSGQVPDLDDATSSPPDDSIDQSGGLTTLVATSTTEVLVFVPSELQGLETLPISITDGDITYVLTVAVADTGAARQQGLMNVADLGDLDGMLFVWNAPTSGSFWMKDTILPLDIAFFDENFDYVDNFSMTTCIDTDDCPDYFAAGAYSYAIEVPETGFAALTPDAKLVLEP